MSQIRPPSIALDQLKDAAQAGVQLALEARTTSLTEQEARETNGGGIINTIIWFGGYLLGNQE